MGTDIPSGQLIIACQLKRGSGASFQAVDPTTGNALAPHFTSAEQLDIDAACAAALDAAAVYRHSAPGKRAELLDLMGEELENDAEPIVGKARLETGLPEARLRGELARTVGQLRLFARVLRDGSFLDVRIDTALPERQPVPRPDIRQMRLALGPVAVFGASNFPLAFSVAGGDTASALAAGAPVVVKAHPAHPGTSELTGRALVRAIERSGHPPGIFSLLFGQGHDLGSALVRHPDIAAVGFTGSRAGGIALMKTAGYRPVPIPVFAEMSSINPVILLPQALNNRATELATGFVASLSLGAGQFCTSPGLVVAVAGDGLTRFEAQAAESIADTGPQTMLTAAIHAAYDEGCARWLKNTHIELLSQGQALRDGQCRGRLFATTAASFLAEPELAEERFGPASLIVRCQSTAELESVVRSLEGQLTTTLQLDPGDYAFARQLIPLLETRAGRILCNGFPTGVEVCNAMVHGGPFPSTSDGRSTSVGVAAIERFLRPVCYQDLPDELLPEALQSVNATGIPRHENSYG